MALSHCMLVLGATGPTGRRVVDQALRQGHSVTALARRPERLEVSHSRLKTVAADVAADAEAVSRTLPGHDVVISVLGRGQSLKSQGLMARATPGIVSAMEGQGVRRLVFLSAYGVGNTAPDAPWICRLMFRVMLGNIYADKAAAEALVRSSTLDWTILAPVLLTNGPATGRFRLGDELEIRGLLRIARADVANAILRCVDDATSVHKRYVVAP